MSRHCFDSVATLVLFVMTKSAISQFEVTKSMSQHTFLSRDIISSEMTELGRDIISLCRDQIGAKT